MKINIQSFSGISPRFSPELLPDNGAQIAENLSIKSGKIHPEKSFVAKVPLRDMVPGQINDDQYNRIYYLDSSGTLKFRLNSDEKNVSISAPGTITLTGKSSPILDLVGGTMNNNSIICNYNSNDDRAIQNIAYLAYSTRTLTAVDTSWVESGDKLVKRYRYMPVDCDIYYQNGKSGFWSSSTSRTLYESYWNITCFSVRNGQTGDPDISFPSRSSANIDTANAGGAGALVDYNGNTVGTYLTYCTKTSVKGTVKVEDFPISFTYRTGNVTVYGGTRSSLNGKVLTYENGRIRNGSMIANTNFESISAGDLMMTIERNYTDIARSAVYVARAVTSYGAEGEPGDVSVLIERKPDEKVKLAVTYNTGTAESESWSKLRIYRSATSSSGETEYLFLKDVNLSGGTVNFEDIATDGDLGEAMPPYGAVPTGLQGIVGMTGGFMAAFKGKDVYFSEPYLPNIWPYQYNQSVPFDIVGMVSRNNYLFVMTKGPLYAFTGDSPDTMSPLNMRFDAPCISRKSICFVDGNIIYASSIGLILIPSGGGSPSVLSSGIYTIEQYKALHFENCTGSGCYDNKYIAFFSDKSLIFDLQGDGINHSTLNASGGTVGTYICTDGSWPVTTAGNAPYGETIIEQNFGGSPLGAVWQSKDFTFDRPVAFSSIRIRHDGGTVGYNLYANGGTASIVSGTIAGNDAVRLPMMRREKKWSVKVTSNVDVFSVELSESMAEM